MRRITAAALSQHSGTVLSEVRRSGEEVVVTHHGNPVARILPYSTPGIASAEQTARLAAALRPDPEWALAMDAERDEDASTGLWGAR